MNLLNSNNVKDKKYEIEEKDFITKKENVQNGIDFYITSQRYAITLGKKLKKALKAEMKISNRLFSVNKQTSKQLYRVNILVRLI